MTRPAVIDFIPGWTLAALCALSFACAGGAASASPRLYDMSVFLTPVPAPSNPKTEIRRADPSYPAPAPQRRSQGPYANSPAWSDYRASGGPLDLPANQVANSGSGAKSGIASVISEIVVGGFLHDPQADHNESDTYDLNLEIIFQKVAFVEFENRFLRGLFAPRPFIGGTYNNEGKTHTAYAGLNWSYQFESGFFIALGLGMTYHTGNLHQATYQCPPGGGCSLPGNRAYVNTGEPSLGSEILFREGLDIGYRFYGGHGISIYAAHISNAGVIDHDNDGMNFVGIRYSYSFD